jgi:chromosome partitioning protein
MITDPAGTSAIELLVPAAPTLVELRRLPATFELAARIDAVSPPVARVLQTKVRTGTRSSIEARELLEGMGYPVMLAELGMRERYSQAFGTVPDELGEYENVLRELLAPEAVTA